MIGVLKMTKFAKLMALMLIPLLVGCAPKGDDEVKAELPMSEHEHKLLLNPEQFENLEQGFQGCWELVKTTAEENGVQVVEYDEDYERSHYFAEFLDTEDLQLSKKGFLIRKRTKVKDGQRNDTFKLPLKFKTTDHAAAAAERSTAVTSSGAPSLARYSSKWTRRLPESST